MDADVKPFHIYRAGDIRAVLIPGLALIAQAGAGCAVLILRVSILVAGRTPIRHARYQLSAGLLIYLSLAINCIIMALIVGRLWWADSELRRAHATFPDPATRPPRTYTKVITALVESGTIYAAFMISYLISNIAGDVSDGQLAGGLS